MANITFSNPTYKDKTVYATAGSHTETILKIAKQNSIPIDFSCGDGECDCSATHVAERPLERGRVLSPGVAHLVQGREGPARVVVATARPLDLPADRAGVAFADAELYP